MNCGLRAGATIVTMPRFDLEQFFSVHQEYGVTRSFVAPPIVVALAKHPIVDQFDLSKLEQVFSGAAPLSAELALEAGEAARLRGRPGLRHDRAVTGLAPHPRRPVQAGVRRRDRAQHRDAHRRPADRRRPRRRRRRRDLGPRSAGDEGLPQQRAATADTIDHDGWLHTGDIGHVDDDGHVFVVDRLKELIKYKGFQVAPAELEALLLTHPAVADAAVIGRAGRGGRRGPRGVRRAAGRARRPPPRRSSSSSAGRSRTTSGCGTWSSSRRCRSRPSGKILRRELKALRLVAAPVGPVVEPLRGGDLPG